MRIDVASILRGSVQDISQVLKLIPHDHFDPVILLIYFFLYVSQLLRVDPSALASSPPAIGWRPASRGRPGATRDGCDLYTFILWAGSTRHDREGGSCSVLYSDLLRAVGTLVPGEMINGASHYGGSPLTLLNKGFANGRQGARRATWTAARE